MSTMITDTQSRYPQYTPQRCINIKVASSDFTYIFSDANSLKGFVCRDIITSIGLILIYTSRRKILILRYYFGYGDILYCILLYSTFLYSRNLSHSNIVVTYNRSRNANLLISYRLACISHAILCYVTFPYRINVIPLDNAANR